MSIGYLTRIVADGGGDSFRAAALRALARGHSQLGDHQDALLVLADFRDQLPDSYHPVMLMAREYVLMGDAEEAGRLYRINTRRFPEQAGTWVDYVRFLWQEKQYREALKQAREFARRLPDDTQAADLIRQLETEVARQES